MFCADDTQIYITIKDPDHSVDSVEIRQACINDVFSGNTQNMLKSNPGKTDTLHFTSPFKKQPSLLETLMLANSTIGIKAKAKNLATTTWYYVNYRRNVDSGKSQMGFEGTTLRDLFGCSNH
mgnify:CR=1 FL=1